MEISEQLRCLFSAQIEQRGDTYTIEIPKEELDLGTIEAGSTYRVALLSTESAQPSSTETTTRTSQRDRTAPEPPLEEGERRRVEIEEIGDQGDGIAKVERGYVVVVPDTDKGERVEIEVTDVRQNVAFAEVTERISYYD